MSKGFGKAASVRKNNTEIDGISRINQYKQQSRGRFLASDSLSSNSEIPPEQLPPVPLGRVVGNDNVESAVEPVSVAPSQPGAATPMTFHDDGTVTVTESQLKMLIDGGVRQSTSQFQQQLAQATQQIENLKSQQDAIADAAQTEKSKLEAELEAEKQQRDRLSRVFSQFGYAPPDGDRASFLAPQTFISPMANRAGISPKDAVREYERRCNDDDSSKARYIATPTGYYKQRNSKYVDSWFLQNRQALREGMDALARQTGLLEGRYGSGKDAPTTFANFPVALREYLSQVVRIEHSPRFVLWQFCNKTIYTGVPVNQTCEVPRVRHLNEGTTSSDWRLTPGIPTVGTRQNLTGNNMSVPILEWGMGKDVTIEPLGIHELVNAVTILDIENLVQQRIGHNYGKWEDTLLFEILLSTTAVVYNSNNSVVTTAAAVAAGGGGQLTMNFLGSLRAHMATRLVPPLDDGCFVFIGTPDHFAPLESDMAEKNAFADSANIEGLTNMLALKTGQEYSGKQLGYKGKVRGFHLYESTNISSGAAGTPGAQTETIGGSAQTTRSGFAFGADAIGMAEAMPMEIRESGDTDFGRMRSLIWKTHANATGLDVDPARTLLPNEVARPVGAEEQLRVFEVRCLTVAV
ncbi:hypothetical protein QT972_00240 [Microcoleus sp. herbarium7]|uniref:hypothetical protein n=1 Tax=Microcoleus sp. herbarium7 TaxID=3055435 RepID=UPI002FCF3B79